MASSSYYYEKYKSKKKEANGYEDDLKALRKALNNLSDTMDDEIRKVNDELEDLKADLQKSIRHNSRFTNSTNSITGEKEKAVTADKNLDAAIDALEEEISRLEGLKNKAIEARDDYYEKYKDAKADERKALLDKIF